ncbi:unnamed protein product [Prunus armeniaca]|uniref:Uncharacterized protein n=1 Tax=Prunus armeniaca TaxID=36596 RepID=A0A6J5WDP0_PRUAR|nr:unnamed protein product [Prunus armeniaca]
MSGMGEFDAREIALVIRGFNILLMGMQGLYDRALQDKCGLGEWWSLGSSLKVVDYFGAVKVRFVCLTCCWNSSTVYIDLSEIV